MMRWITSLISGVALMGVTLSSALPAPAEQAPDKNGPGVTRVSIVQGSVVVQRGDSNKQVSATVNAPLLPGDYISTGATSRGELQFDGSTAVRLGGSVQARITNDNPNNRQLQLADGTIELGLVRNAGTVRVDTPSVTVRGRGAGDYRISIDHDGSTWITARRGTVDIVSPQRTYTLESGRTLVARGSASDPSITYTQEVGYDTFDDFNAKRDQSLVAALNASPNLNPDIAGYDDLGAYGQWQDVAGYGQAWVPQQTSNWAPYSDGSWTWEDGYGWTWVAAEPWGWAPYHYGRWFYANGYGWAWYPPAYNAYPAWSPALVGFFGFGVGGPGWDVSVGFGYPYIGWYPLAPYAPYYPWYPGWSWLGFGWGWGGGGWGCCGGGWGQNVYVTRVTNVYRYFPHGGVHGTLVGNFQHGTFSGHITPVNERNIGSRVGVVHGALPIAPTRDSLGFGGHSIGSPVSLSRAFESPRFSAANRTLAGRTSFDQQERSMSRAFQAHTTTNRVDAQERPSSGSWQRFNENRDENQNRDENRDNQSRGGVSTAQRSDSWGRFSSSRGETYSRNDTYSRSESYGGSSERNPTASGSYERSNPYARSSSYGSYSRSSYPSYARGSYGSPSYSRGSYGSPSYSRGSYGSPSYSRGSYGSPAYSRGSYGSPPYSRGSYGSAPSYSHGAAPAYHGGYSAPHSSESRGNNSGSHGNGRPPQ